MRKITRRDALKVLGATGLSVGSLSAKISGIDKLMSGDGLGSLGIGMHESYAADLIKPGTIINSGNYKNFPQLKQLFPEHQYLRLKKGATRSDFPEIKVFPTRKIQLAAPEQKWKEKNRGVVSIDPKTKLLVNWKAGIPFPEPKNADQVTWNFVNRHWTGDSWIFDNATLIVVDRFDRQKTAFDARFYQEDLKGRTTIPPVPEYADNPRNILWRQTAVFTKPYEIAGQAVLRFRYDSLEKADDVWAYIPAMRRIRRFTGADVQDPLFGSDDTMDDYASWLQKVDFRTVVPTKVKEGNILTWGYPDRITDGYTTKIDGRQMLFPIWEVRPVYILTIEINDPTYMYSKRITWIDKETYHGLYFEGYDQRGNLWRTWTNGLWWTPEGGHNYMNAEIDDWINGTKTFQFMKSPGYNPTFSSKVFTKNFLKRAGR